MKETQQARHTVVYVDDEELARKYFARAAGSDYEVLLADGADEAMTILRCEGARVVVLVTDFRMPGRHGGDLLRLVSQEYPHIVRILVTAYADKNALLEAVNSGEVFQILEKPLGVGRVREVLASATTAAVLRPK
ncbi:response regulator with CheY-like receiver, AAA-type ATPase, and DNA-binding domains [Burkholderia sp. Ch1-1]|jgi:two-component system, response regulator PhcR|uniref:Response regulator with CheY-like receiver, AAA-type ATPase, and DNA-binding domains n=1 Tax=Paraburkholderia dioscoreae TaxID=2604047 RepID=A0A5Q4YWE3_9BURK|nr:response regulator with CheY-like receiver, AAA-type ATPase, and DNA-binding domains [Burkholderia sp. Ch1-1]VVD33425.1 Response regulator with CheY-like receiver, AAA-type ATPase, and DNA-binding domains [Paraburkholderia dioscoreae]